MSNNAVLAALRRLGYSKDEMTGHGFHSMASTLLNEQGWNRDAIERQLAHAERNNIRAAYNYAEYLPERRKMMQHWATCEKARALLESVETDLMQYSSSVGVNMSGVRASIQKHYEENHIEALTPNE